MIEKIHSYLVEWAINFAKNKDVLTKKIESIEKEKEGFDITIKYKDKTHFFLVCSKINNLDGILKKINKDIHCTIVTLNSRGNFNSLINNWQKISEFKFLSIIFANPFSSLDKKWIIFPHVHNKIADHSSLKLGLKSIFETVELVDENDLLGRITS